MSMHVKDSNNVRIGIVGTGMLGSAVAARCVAGKYDVCAYNRRLRVQSLQEMPVQ